VSGPLALANANVNLRSTFSCPKCKRDFVAEEGVIYPATCQRDEDVRVGLLTSAARPAPCNGKEWRLVMDKHCENCGTTKFGLVRQRWLSYLFCSTACKAAFLAKRQRQIQHTKHWLRLDVRQQA